MAPATNDERLAMNDRLLLDQLNDIAVNHMTALQSTAGRVS